MAKEAVFTMKLEAELRDAFVAEAANEDRPASQVMRELMRGYIEKRREARAYDDFVRQKWRPHGLRSQPAVSSQTKKSKNNLPPAAPP